MGKTLVYVVILGILGFGVYYFLIRENDGLYQEREANFSFRDTGAIGKIFMVQNDGQSILLERGPNDVWSLNKTMEAMPIQIRNILTCLKLQTAHSPVSAHEHDRVIQLLAGLSTKVEVYSRNGEKIRSFFVAGQGPNYHGSYMILENAKQAYLVELPGFDGYLTPRFTTEVNDWRSRKVFNLSANQIKDISVNYPDDTLSSFRIDNSSAPPKVLVSVPLRDSLSKVNNRRVNDYLGFYTQINAEGYLNGTEHIDSVISHSRLRCTISVVDKENHSTDVAIYWKDDQMVNLSDQTATDPSHRPKDVERMYAVNHSTKDTLMIQARTFEKLLRHSFEFFQNVPNAQHWNK